MAHQMMPIRELAEVLGISKATMVEAGTRTGARQEIHGMTQPGTETASIVAQKDMELMQLRGQCLALRRECNQLISECEQLRVALLEEQSQRKH